MKKLIHHCLGIQSYSATIYLHKHNKKNTDITPFGMSFTRVSDEIRAHAKKHSNTLSALKKFLFPTISSRTNPHRNDPIVWILWSAQALGGHMNVHRRDRARLKQSLTPGPHNDVFRHQNHIRRSLKSLGSHFPTEVCTLDNYDLDPKLSVSGTINIASTLSSSRFSALSPHENLSDHAFVSPFSSYFEQEKHKGYPHLHNNLSGSDHSLAVRLLNDSESKPDAEKNQGKLDSTCSRHHNFAATDLFMGLSSATNSQSLSSPDSCGNEAISCKGPKTNVSVLSLLMKPRPYDGYTQSEAIGPNSSSMEDIDLELRLGSTWQSLNREFIQTATPPAGGPVAGGSRIHVHGNAKGCHSVNDSMAHLLMWTSKRLVRQICLARPALPWLRLRSSLSVHLAEPGPYFYGAPRVRISSNNCWADEFDLVLAAAKATLA
ncbi:hypothetical protein D5086_015913 [Populus alba]|uniref:Uncharacterized protein n=1 Tax=Populus alba TaxID=43335 RepID=A0ACC4BTR9_POPAL